MTPAVIAIAADREGASDSLGLSTVSVVNLFGRVPGFDWVEMRERGVIGSEGEVDFEEPT